MSESPIRLRGKSGGVVFDGTQSPGGGSQPVTAQYEGNPVTIADGDAAQLTFDTLVNGTDLLDRTDPANPVVRASGLYALTLPAGSNTFLTAGGSAMLEVLTPAATFYGFIAASVASTTITLVVPLAAGDTLQVSVTNNDGAASRDFSILDVWLVKLA